MTQSKTRLNSNYGLIWVSLMLLVGTGCQSSARRPGRSVYPSDQTPQVSQASQWISVDQLASRLNLRVVNQDVAMVTLENDRNTVMLFKYDDGQFSVDGRMYGSVGHVLQDGTGFFVEASLVTRIGEHLSQTPVLSASPRFSRSGRKGTIMIDAGHGGKDPGAISVSGFYEKDITLKVALRLASMLNQLGYRTILTRDNDVFVELEDRCALANRYNPDLFVSLHADSCETPSVTGYTAYVAPSASWRARQAAKSFVGALSQTGTDSRGVKTAKFKVLMDTTCPAVLIEMGYLSNAWEAKRLRNVNIQQRMAKAIAHGVQEFTVTAK
jgi:N-acetylmuramoyl-L-alanine amidase